MDNTHLLFRRFGSYIVDWYGGALVTNIPLTIYSQFVFHNVKHQNLLDFSNRIGLITGTLCFLLAIIYYVIIPTLLWKGQTFGKRIFKIKVVDESGKEISKSQMVIREVVGAFIIEGAIYSISTIIHQFIYLLTGVNLIKILMYVGIVISIISLFLVIVRNHALHDYLAHTKVVSFS